jgi:hypothetical protein
MLAPLARVGVERLAQTVERLLVFAPKVFLFESSPAFVENVRHGFLLLDSVAQALWRARVGARQGVAGC